MGEIIDGGPAFPRPISALDDAIKGRKAREAQEGMSLRDWFAGQALAGMMAQLKAATIPHVADAAYTFADAMLVARLAARADTPDAKAMTDGRKQT